MLRELIPKRDVGISVNQIISGFSDPVDIAETFNDHFVSIGSKLADKIESGNPSIIPEIPDYGLQFELTNVDNATISKYLCELSASRSTGIDGINARLIKDANLELTTPITHIMNLSIEHGIFPDAWKLARVTPLFKDGDKGDLNNYRPISVLPVLGKILEKIIHSDL